MRVVVAFFLKILFKIFFKFKIKNKEILQSLNQDEPLLIIANHTSFIDGLLLGLALPKKTKFVIDKNQARKWYSKIIFYLSHKYEINNNDPLALKSIINGLKNKEWIVLFPEGRLSEHGKIMKIYQGAAMVINKSKVKVLPIFIQNAYLTKFSRIKKKIPARIFVPLSVNITPVLYLEDKNQQETYNIISQKMSSLEYDSFNQQTNLVEALLTASKTYGKNHVTTEDISEQQLTYKSLIQRSFLVSKKLENIPDDRIGILLANSNAYIITLFASLFTKKTACLLNYSMSQHHLLSCLKTSNVTTIISSKLFIKKAKLNVNFIIEANINIIYLEDIAKQLKFSDKLTSLFARRFIKKRKNIDSSSDAIILFTSGSEGLPKGVILTHKNILNNSLQMKSMFNFTRQDLFFNALPLFHSFGLVSATLLPILHGSKVFLFPSPLQYRAICEYVYLKNATVFFGTDTFLKQYARLADPYDFYNIKYIFAGAEKLQESTEQIYFEKFGIRVLQGYGATEASPVISCNSPLHYRKNSVGKILPKIEYKLEEIPGMQEGHKLIIKGPNLMKGYLLPNKENPFVSYEDKWYDTGDICKIDEYGFLYLLGRAKRFAKVAGEMVSLQSVEEQVKLLWHDFTHAIINVPDEKKGEKLILYTTNKDAHLSSLKQFFADNNFSNLGLCKEIITLEEIPILGSGKIDYQALLKLYNKNT